MEVGRDILTFVVAQSPLKETVNNFWQMIWEKNICVIAMISKETVILSLCCIGPKHCL